MANTTKYFLPFWNPSEKQKSNYLDFSGRSVIYVSKGAAATDTRTGLSKYDATRPFATVQAALTAATSGDGVKIGTGTYTGIITLKDGVNIACDPGVTFSYSTTASGQSHINDGGVAVTCGIYGFPNIATTGSVAHSGTKSVTLTGASTVVIECNESNLVDASGMPSFMPDHANATLFLRCNRLINDSYDGIWLSAGAVFGLIDYAECGDNVLELGPSLATTTKSHIRVNYGTTTGSGAAILLGGGGSGCEVVVEGHFVTGASSPAGILSEVAAGDGVYIFNGCRIDTRANASANPVYVQTSGIVDIVLDDVTLLSDASALSVAGSGEVTVYSAVANTAVDPGITQLVGAVIANSNVK